MEEFRDKLVSTFLKCGIKLSSAQIEQFYCYYKLLIEWNQKFNLTAIIDEDDVIVKHFLDSAICYNLLKPKAKIIDVGAGAGFPSIPLKIMNPDLSVLLVDSVNKKILFLQEVIGCLGLKDVSTIHSRAEDLAQKSEYREQFDFCVSRAVAPLSTLAEYCLPLIRLGGEMLAYKSVNVDDELKSAQKAIAVLGGSFAGQVDFSFDSMNRNVIRISKVSKTPPRYPRGANKPRLNPIF